MVSDKEKLNCYRATGCGRKKLLFLASPSDIADAENSGSQAGTVASSGFSK